MIVEELFTAVKSYLDMTWELTEEETIKLVGMISRGMNYLDFVAGFPQDYKAKGQAQALLFDYVRYVRSNALDEFQANYAPELLTLQMMQEVQYDTEQA